MTIDCFGDSHKEEIEQYMRLYLKGDETSTGRTLLGV